jgi:hypothetical protein
MNELTRHTVSSSPVSYAQDVKCCGRIVGGEQWWDINDESVSDTDLRRWCRENFPADSCWANAITGIVTYHVVAYANRHRAIAAFMKTVKWSGRDVQSDELVPEKQP